MDDQLDLNLIDDAALLVRKITVIPSRCKCSNLSDGSDAFLDENGVVHLYETWGCCGKKILRCWLSYTQWEELRNSSSIEEPDEA